MEVSAVAGSFQPATPTDGELEVLRHPVATCGIPDPAVDPLTFYGPMSSEIHAGLTRLYDYPDAGFELELASSYTVERGGRYFTFRLRPGLRFSNGAPIKASDFIWSWNRALRMARHGTAAEVIFSPVVGFDEALGNSDGELSGIKAVDDETLTIELSRPVLHFPLMLANQVAAVLNPSNVSSWDGTWSNAEITLGDALLRGPTLPVGAGPYRLAEYQDAADVCVIELNPHYWGLQADVERVEFIISTPDTAVGDFESGKTDVRRFMSGADDQLESAWLIKPARISSIILNPSIPPLDRPLFRSALLHSTPDFGELASGSTVRIVPEYLATGVVQGLPGPDPEAVLEIMTDCACPLGAEESTIVYKTPIRSLGMTPSEFVFSRWQTALGLGVEVAFAPPNEILSDVEEGVLPLRTVEIYPAFPHASALLEQLIAMIPAQDHPTVRELWDLALEAAGESDAERRDALYLNLEQALLDSATVIPIKALGDEYAIAKPWIHDIGPVWPGASVFRHVRIEHEPLR